MLKIHPAPTRLPARLVTAELRETLPRMQRGESVVVPINTATARSVAKALGVPVLVEKSGVPDEHVRVTRK